MDIEAIWIKQRKRRYSILNNIIIIKEFELINKGNTN